MIFFKPGSYSQTTTFEECSDVPSLLVTAEGCSVVFSLVLSTGSSSGDGSTRSHTQAEVTPVPTPLVSRPSLPGHSNNHPM